MSYFSKLQNDERFLNYVNSTGKYYKVADKLQAHVDAIINTDNFSFIIVRHPLDRLISAFNDRILNLETDQVMFYIFDSNVALSIQSKMYMTKIKKFPAKKDEAQPTFSQFLNLIAGFVS